MKVSPEGIAQIVAEEGIVPGPYLDSQRVWTYGVGHTAAAGDPVPASMPRGMPKDVDAAVTEALRLFAADIARYAADVSAHLKMEIPQHQFDALVGFHYNTGAIGHCSIMDHLHKGEHAAAAAAFDMWHKPAAIIARRTRQRSLFEHGVYSGRSTSVWTVDGNGHITYKAAHSYSPEALIALYETATGVPA